MLQKSKNKLRNITRRSSILGVAAFVLIFGSVGSYFLFLSNAASNRGAAYDNFGVYVGQSTSAFLAREQQLGRQMKFTQVNGGASGIDYCYLIYDTNCNGGDVYWGVHAGARLGTRVTLMYGFGLFNEGPAYDMTSNDYKYQNTINGSRDGYFRELANRLIAAGLPNTILRPAWEMNCACGAGTNNYQLYKGAWQRMHNIIDGEFNKTGKANFKFYWNPLFVPGSDSLDPYMPWYPGDQYVDIMGFDPYDGIYQNEPKAGGVASNTYANPEDVWNRYFLPSMNGLKDYAIAHGKQIGHGEWALHAGGCNNLSDGSQLCPSTGFFLTNPSRSGMDNPTFIQKMFDFHNALPESGGGSLAFMIYFLGDFSHSGPHDYNAFYNGSYLFPNARARVLSLFGGSSTGGTPSPTPPPPTPTPSGPAPNDTNATANAKAVYAYLNSLGDTDKVLSGQQGVVKNIDLTYEFDTIQSQTGSKPAIMGIDYFHWTQNGSGYQFDSATSNAKAKAHWNSGGLIKMSSHAYNPLNGQSGDSAPMPSNNQVAQMVVSGTSENAALNAMLDKIAGGLIDLQNSGVVVIYSPWHEWNFWWSPNYGISQANLKALWRYTRNYMVNSKGVHNVLWSYGPKADGNDPNIMTTYYPGNDVVDVIAPSIYAAIAAGDTFGHYDAMTATGKPFLIGEFGAMSYPSYSAIPGYDQKNGLLTAITNKNPKTVGAMNWWSGFGIHNTASGGAPYMQDSRVLSLGEVNWQAFLGGGSSPTPTPPPPAPASPDLVVTSLTMTPSSPKTGDNVTFMATIKNQGTGATPAGTVIGVAFQANDDYVSWSDDSSASLAAGASRTFTANSGPDGDKFWSPITAGTYTIRTEVNNELSSGRRFSESGETNNVKSDTVTVTQASPTPTFRPEDINQDGTVNILDFSILATNFGKSTGLTNPRADINSDGTVNLLDFSLLAGKFGT